MLYAIVGEDRPDSLAERLAARPAHVERLKALQDEGRLLLAGPFPAIDSPDPGPAGFSGSLIVAEFASLEAARPGLTPTLTSQRRVQRGQRQAIQESVAGVTDVQALRCSWRGHDHSPATRALLAESPGTDRRFGAARRACRCQGRRRALPPADRRRRFRRPRPTGASPLGACGAWRSDAHPDSRPEHQALTPAEFGDGVDRFLINSLYFNQTQQKEHQTCTSSPSWPAHCCSAR
jgi:uncharacterized protein YciI